jgi:hypothetical protein
MTANPLIEGEPDPDRDPYASNQAIPTLLATKYRHLLHEAVPQLRLTNITWFSLFTYPLSGGFQHWSLITPSIGRVGLLVERRVEKILGRIFGFRLLLRFDRQA